MHHPHLTIIHGYTASPQSHWFPWLTQQLEPKGVRVKSLAMPDSCAPQADAWVRYIGQHAPSGPNSFFVAHSLGCIALLRHLAGQQDQSPIGGMILVSGFAAPLPHLPELDPFVSTPLEYASIIRRAPQRAVFASLNDSVVPPAHSADLSQQLQAKLYQLEQGGHFLAKDGFTQFPALLQPLAAMLDTPL